MEPVTMVLGSITIAVVSGAVGRSFNNKNKVKESTCEERRGACTLLLTEKIENLTGAVNDLKDAFNKTVQ